MANLLDYVELVVDDLAQATASSRGEGMALVRTADADAVLATVQAAGGPVTTEMHDDPGGRQFLFFDPCGNVLGVDEPSE